MKLRIRKGVFSLSMIDENGTTVAKISKKKLIGAAKKICDAKGTVIFTTDIVNLPSHKSDWNCANSRKYIIYKNSKPVATATLSFAANEEQSKTPVFTLRLPQVDKMDVETSYGTWVIQRKKDNSLIITHDDMQLGSITPFFTFKPIFFEFLEKYEIVFWAAIYMLVEYMMYEDDLIVV